MRTDIVESGLRPLPLLLIEAGVEARENGLVLPDGLPVGVWQHIIEGVEGQIHATARSASVLQMWLADLMNYGEANYGEMYSQWLDQTSYEYGSLANIAWVGREVPLDIRLPGLSYYHYVQVAPLSNFEEKRAWLEKALEEGWTGRALGDAIGRARLESEGRDPDLYAAEKGVGRAVRALEGVDPGRWADVVWGKLLWPLRHMCEPPEYQRFVRGLKNYLKESDG